MTDVSPPAGDPAEQPVVAMELLDDQPGAPAVRPAPEPARQRWTWAAVALAAAGVLEIIGSVQWLVTQRITDPDGGFMEIDLGATAYHIQSNVAPNYTSIDPPHWGVAVQCCGVLAVLVALGLAALRRGRIRRVARPVATLSAGLLLGSLGTLAMNVWDNTSTRGTAAHVTTTLGSGTWMSAASAVTAIVAIVLILRIDDSPPAPAGPDADVSAAVNAAADAVADLDTPPLGFRLPSADLN